MRRKGNFQHLISESGLLENNRILRCVGRLVNSEEQEIDAHRPIILPRDHAYMTLVIWDCHERVLHSHVRATLAEMHSRYWVAKGRHQAKAGCAVREIQTGDAVTVYEENKKRGEWKMAVAENLIKGKDNVVRAANMRSLPRVNLCAFLDRFKSCTPLR